MSSEVKKFNQQEVLDSILEPYKKEWPAFSVGDTVKVHYKIKEGDKQRIQIYEGVVITISGTGLTRTFIVRRISHNVGVERIFPYHSPSIEKIELVRKGKVRRSRLFYLRDKSGKESRIKELKDVHEKQKASKKKKSTVAAKNKSEKKVEAEQIAEVALPSDNEAGGDTAEKTQVTTVANSEEQK